ncbi:MAG: hypothetical protein CMP61_10490 [Flavobacteriales bacterium]|nr:hypothetical protein [Flavobacteriales bacterium]
MFNMYKLIPILVLLIFSPLLATSQQLYDDFEATANVGYGFINGVYERNLSNPDTTGLNTSLTCAKYTRNIAVPYDVILIEPSDFMNDLSDYLSGNKTMSMYVKTDVSVTVQITLENKTDAQPSNYPTGRHSVYLDTTSGSGEWEKLTFKFDLQPDPTVSNLNVDQMVILFNPGNYTSDVFYIDNIMGPEFKDPCEEVEPIDSIGDNFDCHRNVSFDFSNGDFTVVDNPMKSGANGSNKCGKFKKWITVEDGAFGGAVKPSFTTDIYQTSTFDLYDPNAPTEFFLIFQNENGDDLVEGKFITESTDDWNTFWMDLSTISPSETVEKFVFLLNPAEESEDSIYIDNFIFSPLQSHASRTLDYSHKVNVYPNPSRYSERITIEAKNNIRFERVTLFTHDGKKVLEVKGGKNKIYINTGNLSPGIYFLKGSTTDQQTFTHKIIK